MKVSVGNLANIKNVTHMSLKSCYQLIPLCIGKLSCHSVIQSPSLTKQISLPSTLNHLTSITQSADLRYSISLTSPLCQPTSITQSALTSLCQTTSITQSALTSLCQSASITQSALTSLCQPTSSTQTSLLHHSVSLPPLPDQPDFTTLSAYLHYSISLTSLCQPTSITHSA